MAEVIVEIQDDRLFGGENLEATIIIRADETATFNARLLAAQFVGMITFDPKLIDASRLDALKKYPSYYNSSASGMMGGGQLIKTAIKPSEVPIYSVPPSIISAGIQLEPEKSASCKRKFWR